MPWSIAGSSYGFGADGSWLPQPTNWGTWSVEAQDGKNGSTLELYREAISERKEHLVGTESFEWVDAGDEVLAFDREGVRVMVNLGQGSPPLPQGEILLSSGEVGGHLPPDTAVWIHR
jgi:alpha-glucosidase